MLKQKEKMNYGPKVSSKTYVHKSQGFLNSYVFKNVRIGFLITLVLFAPVLASILNPFNNTAKADATLTFAKNVGGTGYDYPQSIATDSSGNLYITGGYADTVDFDPGAGTTNLTSAGNVDVYIAKYDSSGNLVYVKGIGGTSTDVGNYIYLDSTGNIYTTGTFNGTVDFDPGAGTTNLTSAGNADVYVAKYDSSGNFVLAKNMGGTGLDQSFSMIVDASGNMYTVGTFSGTADFDPGAGTSNLTVAGLTDIFISKLDSSGNFVFAKQFGGTSSDYIYSIAFDSTGNIYTVGGFEGTADFDPGAGTSNLVSAGGRDIYISKLDTSGNFVFVKQMGSTSTDYMYSLAFDSDDNMYVTGIFSNTVDFDPGVGTADLTSAGLGDLVVAKYTSSGNYVFAKGFGGSSSDFPFSLKLDSSNNIYTVGGYTGTVDFDPGAGTANLVSAGSIDIYVSKLDSSGNYVFTKSMGGAGSENANSLALDSSSNIFVGGTFGAVGDYDPGAGTTNLTPNGSNDIFFVKLSQLSAPTVTDSAASAITDTTATLNGNITATGGENATERGFEYGLTNGYGTTAAETVGNPYGTGTFTADLTGLTCNTVYYYRAYAINGAGTGTSAGSTFTTSACPEPAPTSSSGSRANSKPSTTPTAPASPTAPSTNPGNPNNTTLNPKTNVALVAPVEKFLRNLSFGSIGEDVRRLQKFLNVNEYVVSPNGAGSVNNETNYFGTKTRQAVIVFQEAFAPSILNPLGLKSGTGYFGDQTRNFINSLLQ